MGLDVERSVDTNLFLRRTWLSLPVPVASTSCINRRHITRSIYSISHGFEHALACARNQKVNCAYHVHRPRLSCSGSLQEKKEVDAVTTGTFMCKKMEQTLLFGSGVAITPETNADPASNASSLQGPNHQPRIPSEEDDPHACRHQGRKEHRPAWSSLDHVRHLASIDPFSSPTGPFKMVSGCGSAWHAPSAPARSLPLKSECRTVRTRRQ